jgi:uncharacterized protein YwgA
MFENRVLRRIFGPKSEEVTQRCDELYNEEFIAQVSNYCFSRTQLHGVSVRISTANSHEWKSKNILYLEQCLLVLSQ